MAVRAERAELRGRVLDGRYHVGRCIGVGGTGVVFEAEDVPAQQRVVVKTMRPVFAFNRDLGRRLRREGEVSRTVHHPGIVPVLDEGILFDGSPYIVMQHLTGDSLTRLLHREGSLTVEETVAIAMRVCGILHAAHGHGYVHRDVKPEHVLLDRAGDGSLEVRLLDFGVCASSSAPAEERKRERGRVFGTPTYVSPEQAAGDPDVDARTDIFGLGVVMFECLTGRPPFTATDVNALLRRIIREDAPRVGLLVPEVGMTVDALVAKALARDPEQRFRSARAMARALAPYAANRVAIERRLGARLVMEGEPLDDAVTVERDAPAAA